MSPLDLNLKFLSLSSSKLRVYKRAGCLRDCMISKMLAEFLRSLSNYRMNGQISYIAKLYDSFKDQILRFYEWDLAGEIGEQEVIINYPLDDILVDDR